MLKIGFLILGILSVANYTMFSLANYFIIEIDD